MYISRVFQQITKMNDSYLEKLLLKYSGNPIICPNITHPWEAYQTFNAGAILLEGKVHLVYRAVGVDEVSRFGYACSEDGFQVEERSEFPIYERPIYEARSRNEDFKTHPVSGGGFYGCEDPRLAIVKDDDNVYMTYTAFDPYELRVGITSIRVSDFLSKRWRWKGEKLLTPPGETHKNFVLFPEKIRGKYAVLHSISPKISIAYLDSLDLEEDEYILSQYRPTYNPEGWEAVVKGAGAPPLKTDEGWILFYHGIDKKDGMYKIGVMLLDTENPEEVLYRSPKPILKPDHWYENNGFKPGVVYTCGAVIKDERLLLYYGAADNYVCVAHAQLEFLDALGKGALKERSA